MLPSHALENAYTDSPKQHRNLILGSLQILFWLIFRPSAWENHLQTLNPSFQKNVSLIQIIRQQQWRFILQVFGILPILFSLLSLIIVVCFSEVTKEAIIETTYISAYGTLLSVIAAATVGTAYGAIGSAAIAITSGIIYIPSDSMTLGLFLGIACGATLGIGNGIVFGKPGDLKLGVDLTAGVGSGLICTIVSIFASTVVNRNLGALTLVLLSGLASVVISSITVSLPASHTGVTRKGKIGTVVVASGLGTLAGAAYVGILNTVDSLAYGKTFALSAGLAVCIGMWINWWRPVIMSVLSSPWNFLLYQLDNAQTGKLHSLLPKHIAFWDEWQYLPIQGLDKHLLLSIERHPTEGQAALNYLSTTRQRWAAVAAQIELDARQLDRCDTPQDIARTHQTLTVADLDGPATPLFRSFNRLSEDTAAALSQASPYNQRLALTAVAEKLDALIRELTRSSDKYAVRFRPIAQRWSTIIALHLQDLAQAAEQRQDIDSPYIIGVPLTERQEIFVGRTDISARIEQLLLDRRRPPLLLYGQRRTGKTSLLNNLGRLLPNSVVPLFIDLQGPASSASDHTGFLYNLARGMITSAQRQRSLPLPPLTRDALTADPFTSFDEWLDNVEATLQDSTALLAFDEFEVLDKALTEGRFSETAVLGMLRNLIQHRPRFKVLLAGSHTLEEFQRWSSYLINAQTLHLGYLKADEAHQLIERPSPDFSLRYQPEASQRVFALTQGHPFLVQLLCAEIVVLKNEQDPSVRRLATLDDVEAAIPEALSSGSMFFSDIEGNQLSKTAVGVMQYLSAQGEHAVVSHAALAQQCPEAADVNTAIALLQQRELIDVVDSGYQIRVELIRRWFCSV